MPGGDAPRRRLRGVLAEVGYRVIATSRWGVNVAIDADAHGLTWVKRCTVRGAPDMRWMSRLVAGDPWLGRSRAVREWVLHHVRARLGPSRYARWRRRFLDLVAGRVVSAPPS